MRSWLGSILVLLSATTFGFMVLFRSWAKDVSVPMLLFLRFAIAAALLMAFVAVRRLPMPRGRTLAALIAMGALGYFGEAYLYFAALDYAPGGLVALLLYTYPGVVTVVSVLFLKERLTPLKLAALLLAIAGSAATLVPVLTAEHSPIRPLGVILGLACSLSYSLYILAGARLPKGIGATQSSAIVTASCAAMFGIVTLVRWQRNEESLPHDAMSWLGILSLAVICTVLGVSAFLAGLARVGPVRASTLSVFEPAMTVAVGALCLKEQLTPVQYLGGALILAAALLAARGDERRGTPEA